MPDEDQELVCSAQAGDGSAFAELVAKHKRRVFGLASRFTRDPYQLDDLAQETFIRAWQRIGKFRGESPFEHWLVRIAIHACYDFLRRQRRSFAQQTVSIDGLDLAADQSDRFSAEAARELVESALARLKPDERLVLALLELEEKSVRETAELTGWSESNVKVRAFRARQALKKVFNSSNTGQTGITP